MSKHRTLRDYLDFFQRYLAHMNKEVSFRLVNPKQEDALYEIMFSRRIPIGSHQDNSYYTSRLYVKELRRRGFDVKVSRLRNLGDLPQEERNRIKERAGEMVRDPEHQRKVLDELPDKYS